MRGEEPPIAAADMEEILVELEDATRNLREATRDSETFWLTRYYATQTQNHPKKTFTGTILKWLKQESGLAVVMLEDTGLERKLKVDKHQRLGSRVNMRVKEADPFRDRLNFAQLKK